MKPERMKTRYFKMTDKFVSPTCNLERKVINYKWDKCHGLRAELYPDVWVKSDYTLKEFLAGMNGRFQEVKPC